MQLLEVEKGSVELKKGTSDSEIKKYTDKGMDVQLVDPATEKLEEEAGRKYTAEEAGAVGKTVGKSLLKVLRGQGDEVVDIRLTGIGLNKFGIKVKYGNDKGQDLFKFTLDPDTESIILHSGTEPVELVDFVITQGNTVSLPTPELEDKLSDAMKKYTSEPSPEEYDQMAAMEPESDPSQINKHISEEIDEALLEDKGFGEYFSIPGLGEFRTVNIRDGIVNAVDSSQNKKSFRLEKVQQENPNYGKKAPREKKPQGVRPYTEVQYRKILQGAIDDAGSTEFAYDIADSMIYDPQILARLKKDYPGESARELKLQLQYDLEACDSPEDDYDDDYEGEVAENMAEGIKDFFKDPMQAADARGWIRNPKLSDIEKRDKIKSVMKDPTKFNDLMDSFTDELGSAKKTISKNINEITNPELTKYVNRFVGGLASKYDYSTQDAVYAIMEVLRSQGWKGLNEDLDIGHQDDEPGMLLSDIYGIMQSSKSLYELVSQFKGQGEVDFPHWWQAKIVNAKANLSAARQYLDYEVNKPQQVNISAVALQERKKK